MFEISHEEYCRAIDQAQSALSAAMSCKSAMKAKFDKMVAMNMEQEAALQEARDEIATLRALDEHVMCRLRDVTTEREALRGRLDRYSLALGRQDHIIAQEEAARLKQDAVATAQDVQLAEKDAGIAAQSAELDEKTAAITAQDAKLYEMDAKLNEKDAMISTKDAIITMNSEQLNLRVVQLRNLGARVDDDDMEGALYRRAGDWARMVISMRRLRAQIIAARRRRA